MKTQYGGVRKRSGSWAGCYATWFIDDTGKKIRRQHTVKLGRVATMSKTEARRELKERIDKALGLVGDSRKTVGWFIDSRWVPLRDGNWRSSTKATNLQILGHVKHKWGSVALENVDSVELQIWINTLAKKFSGSVVRHVRIFIKSIFAEAVEQDFLHKSPARLLKVPPLRESAKPFLSIVEIKRLLAKATGRDKLILRLFLVTGMRPSELFALQWKAFNPELSSLTITQSIYRGEIRPYTKTTDAASRPTLVTVFLPQSLTHELCAYRKTRVTFGEAIHGDGQDGLYLIFRGKRDQPLWKENYQRRVLTPLAKKAKVHRLNFQILRRSAATHAQRVGTPRDIASILRHKNVDTAALHYVQSQDAEVKQAVDALARLLIDSDEN